MNFPEGRALRKQWNIGFAARDNPDEDFVRIGFRLSDHAETPVIMEYLEFREQVRRRQAAFDSTFQALGNYYEFLGPGELDISESAVGPLSAIIIADEPPLDGWRFFGRRLRFRDP